MKTNTHRNVGAAVLLLGGLAGASSAQAVAIEGALGAPSSATDVYLFVCPSGIGASAVARVQDMPPIAAPLVSLQMSKYGTNATGPFAINVTDSSDGNDLFSNQVTLGKGGGTYTLLVDKTGAGVEAYRVFAICTTIDGLDSITPGSVQQTQNE